MSRPKCPECGCDMLRCFSFDGGFWWTCEDDECGCETDHEALPGKEWQEQS